MTVFGFVFGFAVTAGGPCGSLGQCLQYVAESGPAGFTPSALISGATGALLLATVVCAMSLAVHGIRKVLPRGPAIRSGDHRRVRPTPLLLAVGAAFAWAILSIGPGRLVEDLGELIPRDTVTSPSCPFGSEPAGATTSCWQSNLVRAGTILYSTHVRDHCD